MTAELKQTIAARLRAARLRAGLSQEKLAAQIGRTPESISNIERAQQLPTLDTLIELTGVLGLNLAELLDWNSKQARRVTPKRAHLEAQLTETMRSLSDKALAIAHVQAQALTDVQ